MCLGGFCSNVRTNGPAPGTPGVCFYRCHASVTRHAIRLVLIPRNTTQLVAAWLSAVIPRNSTPLKSHV